MKVATGIEKITDVLYLLDYIVENDKPEKILHDNGNSLHPERSDF